MRWVTLIFLSALLLSAVPVHADVGATATWDRETAVAVARSVDSRQAREDLLSLTLSGQPSEVIELLDFTRTRDDWPTPARERAVFEYVEELRKLPSDVVSHKVMAHLKAWEAETLIPHDDHPRAGVPLYNIRGAAQGVENSWRRQEALIEGRALLASNPRSLVDAFVLDNHPSARRGYLESLDLANTDQLDRVGQVAIRRLHAQPELTGLGGKAALKSGDIDALQQVFMQGQGADLAHLMRDSAEQLSAADNAALLAYALDQSPAINASLAIAELTPAAANEPGIQNLLLDQLADPELGSAAALALADHASLDTLSELQRIAGGGQGLAAYRARLALDMSPYGELGGELR